MIAADPDEILVNEEKLSEIIGEHLVNFGVCTSTDLAWVVCDKILKEFERNDVPSDLLYFEGDEEEEDGEGEAGICPICNREIPLTFHHSIPKSTHRKMMKLGYTKIQLNTHGIDI